MKKFISMVMAAAMVVTMVPATAFAANKGEFKVVGAQEVSSTVAAGWVDGITAKPEIQIKVKDVDASKTTLNTYDVTLKISGAEFLPANKLVPPLTYDDVEEGDPMNTAWIIEDEEDIAKSDVVVKFAESVEAGDKVIKLTITETDPAKQLADGDIIVLQLPAGTLGLTKSKVGHQATVKVVSDFGDSEEMPFVTVVDKGIKVELDDDVVKVAEEEVIALEDIVVKPVVGSTIGANITWDKNEEAELTLKLSKGFEFANTAADVKINGVDVSDSTVVDGNKITVALSEGGIETAAKWVITGLKVEADTAKSGDVCTLTVDVDDVEKKTVEVAKVIDYKVVMELVDPDEDVPVFYSGVNVDNDGLTVDDDHVSLDVNLYETFIGAWANNKAFTLSLPEGVWVTAVDVSGDMENEPSASGKMSSTELVKWFTNAYIEGDHEAFEFAKRTWEETEDGDDKNDIEFNMTLVADPGFVGDVVLKLEGAAVDTQEVVIAKFVAPLTVKAEQNDVIIDYRYTEVPTGIVVTEAEAGLWDKDLEVTFTMEKLADGYIEFEDKATVSVNEESEMEVKEQGANNLSFKVTEESDDEAAVVTIDGIELFMQRNIPAGPYALDMAVSYKDASYDDIKLLGQVKDTCHTDCEHGTVKDVCDYETTVHEAWINVVTAGRDQDDASFTTKVVVPVGESYIVAGDKQIALDVPAYINADGYTMLPVRAVATALGINNDAVQWNQATKTVIIMYGQRIITMTAGQSVVYVSGTAIPAASSVEIVDGRAFLGLRDLATTLGVATINWDPATKVASLN